MSSHEYRSKMPDNIRELFNNFEDNHQFILELSRDESQEWKKSAINALKKGKLRTLVTLGVPLDLVGSGVVVRNLLKEFKKENDDVRLLTAHFTEKTHAELGIDETIPVDTVLFSRDNGDGEAKNCDVSFPVPVFSAGFQFPNIRYMDMTEQQLIEYLEVYAKKLSEVIREFKPHVIHTNHLFLLNPLIKLIAPWIPLVCTSHGTEEKMLTEDGSLLPLVAPGVKAVERIIAVSDDVKRQAVNIFGVDERCVSSIGNGYDSNLFYPRALDRKAVLGKYGVRGDYKKIIVFLGKFSEWKGIKFLIKASKYFVRNTDGSDNFTFIAGNGSDMSRQEYNTLIKELGLDDNVKVITPPDNRPDLISEIMAAGDVFVLPSVSEPFGLVLLEALGSGLRTVYANSGGPRAFVPQQLIDRKLAIPIEPLKMRNDTTTAPEDEAPYALRIADAVNKLLANDSSPEEKMQISDAVKHLSWKSVYRKTKEIYCEAILSNLERADSIDNIYTVPLHSPAARLKTLVGSKAEGLNFLIHSNVPVPSGFVLTTVAFNDFVSQNSKLKGKINITDLINIAPMPEFLAKIIRDNVNENLTIRITRSSATKEDNENDSYSGQYVSVPGLNSDDEVMAGIREVWASMFSERLMAYRSVQAGKGTPSDNFGTLKTGEAGLPCPDSGIAVIIQDYIDAKASGVAHSVNVENGFPEIIIECGQNAEDVTDSRIIPDKWRFINDNGKPILFERIIQPKNDGGRALTPSLTDGQASEIAGTIIRLSGCYEEKTGMRNIDVEFCIGKNDALYFLQIRPLNNVHLPNINPVCTGVDWEHVKPEKGKVTVDGITANPGVVTGRLVVIDLPGYGTEADYFSLARDVIKNGDIVCTPTVNISWTILFDRIAGLIVERGGVTSHSANIAREKGIPCLVGAENVCDLLKNFHEKSITLDSFNSIVYEGEMPLVEKPLNELIWRAMRDNREYDRKEPSHWIDTDGKEWARKPINPLNPLQFQLYLEAWEKANKRYPHYKIPLKTKGDIIYAGFDEMIALGDAIGNGEADDPFDFFDNRRETVQKLGEMIASLKIDSTSLKKFFDLYTHMIMHFHLRAEFRRRAALVLRDKAIKNFPDKLINIINCLICVNSPVEMIETRRYDEAYRALLRSLDERERAMLTGNNADLCEIRRDDKLLEKLDTILLNYKISRQQLDDWDAPLPMTGLVGKIRKDLRDGVDSQPLKAQTIRTVAGFEAFLKSLKPSVLEVAPTFDFDSFVKVIVLSEKQAVQVDNEHHWQHRWQQMFRTKLLAYAKRLVDAGLLSSPEEILAKNKDEVLILAAWLEKGRPPKELVIMSDKAVRWQESVDSIELHLTNRCNLDHAACCKDICTYNNLHEAGATFPFQSLDDVAKFKPKLVFLCGGGEPTLYKDGIFNFAHAVYRLRELLPDAEIVLGTNGVVIPAGDWQKEIAAVRIGLHGYQEDTFNAGKPAHTIKAWENIWKYFTSGIGETWVTFRYDRQNYTEFFSIAEKLWTERQRLCGANPDLIKKELGIKIMAVADDSQPADPYHLSNPTSEIQRRWKEKCDALMRGDTPFGEYLRKISDGFIDAGFSLPRALFTMRLPVHKANPAEKCWPVTKYMLVAADGIFYPCAVETAHKRLLLGASTSSVNEILNKRKEVFYNPDATCRKGCRMLTTFISTPLIHAIKKETSKILAERQDNDDQSLVLKLNELNLI